MVLLKTTAILFIGLLCMAQAHGEEKPAPYSVTWPEGWPVTRLFNPILGSGKMSGGERIRATLSEASQPIAIVELTHIVRRDGGAANLEEEFDAVIGSLKKAQIANGSTFKSTPPKATVLAGHPALETEIAVGRSGATLHQSVAMTMTPENFYSLNYSAWGANADRYREEFRKTRDTLKLR